MAATAFLASATAIFGQRIINWIWRPKLTVKYVHSSRYCEKAVARHQDQSEVDDYYFSLRVSNVGSKPAVDVEVFVYDIRGTTHDGQKVARRYALDLNWAYLGKPSLPTLPPEVSRFCNIGHILDPDHRSKFDNEELPAQSDGKTLLSLALQAEPHSRIHLLEPGRYKWGICVVAANHRPVKRSLKIHLKGDWYKERKSMLKDGIRIKLH